MAYTALYRKFRPSEFEEVKGQEAIVTALKNQVKSGRNGHAYLFCGTRGTGKTTVAKILAKAVNCEHPVDGSPCNECSMCRAINSQVSMNVIEIDAASNNSVDNIREIIDEVQYSPTQGRYKVYIIDEVHMLSTGAFNALLKTLEEPPSYVIFILATTEAHKIPITILSRCQRYDFKRITVDTIAARLKELSEKEGLEAEDKAIRYVAKAADGSMRDALSLYDQCIAFYFGKKLTYDSVLDVLGAVDTEVFTKLLAFIIDRQTTEIIELLDDVITQGRELLQFVVDFTWYLRNILLLKSSNQAEELVDVSEENMQMMKQMAELVSIDSIMRYIRILSELSNQLRYASQKRVLTEIALIKLCRPEMEHDYESLSERLNYLEERMNNGTFVQQRVSAAVPMHEAAAEVSEAAEVPPATTEEMEMIRGQWKEILPRITNPLRTYLNSANPYIKNGSMLSIVFSDETMEKTVRKEEHIAEIRQAVKDFIDRDIEIITEYYGNGNKPGKEYEELGHQCQKKVNIPIEFTK